MELSRRNGQLIVLLALVMLIVPMLVFPRQFGTELARASLIKLLYEAVYYGAVLYFFNRHTSLVKLAQSAGVCLLFRIGIGGVFGLLLAAMYSMNLSVSLGLALSGYIPGVLFHVAATPFVLSSVLVDGGERRSRRARRSKPPKAKPVVVSSGHVPIGTTAAKKDMPAVTPEPVPITPASSSQSGAALASDAAGFDRATSYIFEHGSVHLAAVVDREGLLVSHYARGDVDAEQWAPMALVFCEANDTVMERVGRDGTEKIDLIVQNDHVVIVREGDYWLLVVADRQNDEFLSIRISQGLEMVRRHVAERYQKDKNSKTESSYVSSAQ